LVVGEERVRVLIGSKSIGIERLVGISKKDKAQKAIDRLLA
jgi:hypothetical protein